MRKPAQTPRSSAIDSRETPDSADTLLTVAQVAARYQTGREEVHRWIRDLELDAFRVGKLVRVRRDALAEFEKRKSTLGRSKR